MRLFAAVRPPDDVLAHLELALTSVRGGPADGGRGQGGLRWTSPESRHVTLAFYGQTPEGYLDDLVAGIGAIASAAAPFDAALSGAGVFDGRTLWVGCTGEGWAPLMTAAGGLGEELLGRPADGRNRPHLTVARAPSGGPRGGRGDRRRAGRQPSEAPGGGDPRRAAADLDGGRPADLAHALALYRGPAWTVREVELVSSRLGAGPGGGALHAVVHRAALGAVAG